MKKIILFVLVSLSINTFAQKEIKEGVLIGKMEMSSTNQEVAAQLAMVGETKMTTYFSGKNSRLEMSGVMIGNNTTIMNSDKGEILNLTDNPMKGKLYEKIKMEAPKDDLNIDIKETGDTKTIAGYVCKGYTTKVSKDGVDMVMTMYTTDKIQIKNKNTEMLGDKIKGYPLLLVMEMTQMGVPMKINMEITEVKVEKVDASKFDLTIPEGYTEKK